MRILLLLLFFTQAAHWGYSQMKPVYSFPPKDSLYTARVYTQAAEHHTLEIQQLSKENREDFKSILDKRFEMVADLFENDRIISYSEATDFLQKVSGRILQKNPELNSISPRILFSRDWWPNAYSVGEGTLVINAGLLIHLNNEAELAFVISHELAHLYLDHSNKAIRKNINTVKSPEFQQELKRLSKQEYGAGAEFDKLLKNLAFGSRKHSRTNEAEADLQAWKFLRNSGYDCNGIRTCLQLLDKVDQLSLYAPIHLNKLFNFSEYPFKKRWIENESAIFGAMAMPKSTSASDEDSLKTHPDCSRRIEFLQDSIALCAHSNSFVTNENQFKVLQKEFEMEVMEGLYNSKNYSKNLYCSLQLLQSEKEEAFAVFNIARVLNTIFEKQKSHELGKWIDKEDRKQEEDFKLLLRMLDRIRLDELAQLSYNFCFKYKDKMVSYEGFTEEFKKSYLNLKKITQ